MEGAGRGAADGVAAAAEDDAPVVRGAAFFEEAQIGDRDGAAQTKMKPGKQLDGWARSSIAKEIE